MYCVRFRATLKVMKLWFDRAIENDFERRAGFEHEILAARQQDRSGSGGSSTRSSNGPALSPACDDADKSARCGGLPDGLRIFSFAAVTLHGCLALPVAARPDAA